MASSEYYKQDLLVREITEILQKLLTEKKKKWQETHSSDDFFASHTHKKWDKDEQTKLDLKDISYFDGPLCCKFLLEFPWNKADKLKEKEKLGIEELRNIRNLQKHIAKSVHVTKEMFKENCTDCRVGLRMLNVPIQEIDRIIAEAENLVVKESSAQGSFTLDFKKAEPKIVFTRVNGILFDSISDDELESLKFTLASRTPPILTKHELGNLKKVEGLLNVIHRRSSSQVADFLSIICQIESLFEVKDAIIKAIEENQKK